MTVTCRKPSIYRRMLIVKVRIGQGWDVDVAENTRRDKD